MAESAIARHTPGPWTVDHPHVRAADTASRNEGRAHAVAEVCTNRKVFVTGEAKANAHLIAAAPEMREALEGVTPLCNAINELIADDEDLRARVMALFIKHGLEDDYGFKVAQAIAKAEGRSL